MTLTTTQLQAWRLRCLLQSLRLFACEVLPALPLLAPVFFAGFLAAKGNAGFCALPQVWAFGTFPEFPVSFSRTKGICPTKCLRKLLPFDKGEFLLLFT